MSSHEEVLERKLLLLGHQKLEIETRMKQLPELARQSGKSGHVNDADAAWNLFEKLRYALGKLQSDIAKVGREL